MVIRSLFPVWGKNFPSLGENFPSFFRELSKKNICFCVKSDKISFFDVTSMVFFMEKKGMIVSKNVERMDFSKIIKKGERFKVNPFIENVKVLTKNKKITVAKGRAIVDLNSGEIEGWTEVSQVVEVDKGQFIKLFTNDLAIWFELNKPGIRVFGALLVVVQNEAIGKDIVFFDFKNTILKEFKISKSTFYRGIEELLEKKFIARHISSGWFFINPLIFFNGNRAKFIRDYKLKDDYWNSLNEEKKRLGISVNKPLISSIKKENNLA